MIKGCRPLTHHISSITITTKNAQVIKMNKLCKLQNHTEHPWEHRYRVNKFSWARYWYCSLEGWQTSKINDGSWQTISHSCDLHNYI